MVGIEKRNGEEITTIEYLPQANYYNYLNTIKISTYSDGSIGFESLDGKIKGFYDADGNKISFRRKTDNYEIEDVKDDKVIIDIYEEQKQEDGFWTNVSRYYIYDKKGEFYLKANKIEYIKDMYLIIDEDNKMALYDKNLNKISNQYNRILPNGNLEFELSYI